MMRSVQVLARIRLNLASVDQFLAIACDLADDNPDIKERIYMAAKEARAAALLIDHLRGLFNRQQTAEVEAQQQQQRYTSQPAPDRLHLQQNSQLFTYSNQQTLVRASKSLVANVAKILYLTDSIVLQQIERQHQQLQLQLEQQLALEREELNQQASRHDFEFGQQQQLLNDKRSLPPQIQIKQQQPVLSDRLDNVANYSQLLRSFGELSIELVDLGHCVMLSEAHGVAATSAGIQLERRQSGSLAGMSLNQQWRQQQAATQGNAASYYCPAAQTPATVIQLPTPTTSSSSRPRQMGSSNSSLSLLRQEQELAEEAEAALAAAESFVGQAPPTSFRLQPDCELVLEANAKANRRTPADAWTKHFDLDNPIEAQIQDMQILFQVNRLIIDRSILLLLSASKCCLRLGIECLRGLEARRSVVVQIRASISIIMAIVKCSVFSSANKMIGGGNGSVGKVFGPQAMALVTGQAALSTTKGFAASALGGVRFGAETTAAATTATTTITTSNSSGMSQICFQPNSVTNMSFAAQRNNQFAHHHLACQSSDATREAEGCLGGRQRKPPSHPFSFCNKVNGHNLASASDELELDYYKDEIRNLLDSPACSYRMPLREVGANKLPKQRPGAADLVGWHHFGAQSDVAESPLQIMNYFLQTWNGTQSAHDAINRLQLLVRPFTRLANYKSLVEALESTLKAHQKPLYQIEAPQRQTTLYDETDEEAEARSSMIIQKTTQFFGDTFGFGPNCHIQDESNNNKENQQQHQHQHQQEQHEFLGLDYSGGSGSGSGSCGPILMNKRQLVANLNAIFLGEAKANLIERAHEFTDCAYTKHEHRETILMLLHCIKLQLNKIVKLIYRLRRKSAHEFNLSQLRQLANQLDETCAELKCELQTVVIEQSDELDRFNAQLDLMKQIKHHSLVGDVERTAGICSSFVEQSEQLIEVCKMLNQVAPTNKMKITTKSLTIWFDLNVQQLCSVADCLSRNPRSRVVKDCLWAYIQVWCSFYDDFCQTARQVAYLAHSRLNSERSMRVQALRDQLLMRHQQLPAPNSYSLPPLEVADLGAGATEFEQQQRLDSQPTLADTFSVQSLNMAESMLLLNEATDSPRSLDHYYGFGANYHRHSRIPQQDGQQVESALSLAYGDFEEQPRSQSGARLAASQMQPVEMVALASQPTRQPFGGLQVEQQENRGYHGRQQVSSAGYFVQTTQMTNACDQRQIPGGSAVAIERRPAPLGRQVNAQGQHRRPVVTIDDGAPTVFSGRSHGDHQGHSKTSLDITYSSKGSTMPASGAGSNLSASTTTNEESSEDEEEAGSGGGAQVAGSGSNNNTDQQSNSTSTEVEKWSDSDADAIIRGAKETAQMALSMYQFTKGEGDLNTTQDLFTQAELFAEEANELYKEVRCFSYKVPTGDLKKELLAQLGTIPALVQQLQFIVKNPTVGKPATFAKVDSVIRETKTLMEAVNRVVSATLACRQHYNMAIASMRRRNSYRADKDFEFESHSSVRHQNSLGGRHGGGGGMGSEPDI